MARRVRPRNLLLLWISRGSRFFCGSVPAAGRPKGNLRRRNGGFVILIIALAIALTGCGYHVAGRAATFPSDWQTIAVPAFVNKTARYRIEQQVTEAVIREMISRTHYRIVQNTDGADAVLRGSVLSIETTPILFDATTGQATTMLVTVHVQADLVDNHTQKTVYKANDMVFRNEYQISSDIRTFFEEEDPAVQRMAHDFASQFVSDMLENF